MPPYNAIDSSTGHERRRRRVLTHRPAELKRVRSVRSGITAIHPMTFQKMTRGKRARKR
jgi:hypothetical protein